MQRLPNRSWQVYQDFQAPNFPTPADPNNQTDGALIAYNRTHSAEVPTEVGAAVAGHPGIVKVAFKSDGSATQRINIRVGQKCMLKDLKRFGITLKTDDSTGSTGYLIGFGSSVNNPASTMFFYNYRPGAAGTGVTIQRGVSGNPQYSELYNDDFAYNSDENGILSDPTLIDWHTLEVELDYAGRRATFFINDDFAGMVTVEEAQWDREMHPFVQFLNSKTANIYIDELAFSTVAWEANQDERIQDPQDYDIHDDFLVGTTATAKAGEERWASAASDLSACDSTPSPIAGHPGLVTLTCVDQTTFGDAGLSSDTTNPSFKPRDLARFGVTWKPAALTADVGLGEGQECCEVWADSIFNKIHLGLGYGGGLNWHVYMLVDSVETFVAIPTDLAPVPDGDTWFKCEGFFDYANRKIKYVINDVPVWEGTISDEAWWSLGMILFPAYLYTEERVDPTTFSCVVDEVAIKFQPDTTDERPETNIRELDGRERFNTNTTRTDNF